MPASCFHTVMVQLYFHSLVMRKRSAGPTVVDCFLYLRVTVVLAGQHHQVAMGEILWIGLHCQHMVTVFADNSRATVRELPF